MTKKKFKIFTLLIMLLLIISCTFSYCAPKNNVVSNNSTSKNNTSNSSTNSDKNSSSNNNVNSVENNTSETTPQVKNDDLFINDTTVTLDQAVQGNVYIVANKAVISAPVYGNIYVLAPTIEFKNPNSNDPIGIRDSAYLFGTKITLNIDCQDLYAFASSSLTINYNSRILRDIRSSTPKFNMYGAVGRNVYVDSSSISLENSNNQKGFIEGNLNYYNTDELSITDGVVNGDVFYNVKVQNDTPAWLNNIYISIMRFITSVLFLLVFTRVFPIAVHPQKDFILKKFLGIFLYGLFIIITIPICCLVLVYLLPRLILFALPIILLYCAFLLIGLYISLTYIVGLLQRKFKYKSIFISIGILFVLNLILFAIAFLPPIVSLIVALLLIIPGFGLLANRLLEKRTLPSNGSTNKKANKK